MDRAATVALFACFALPRAAAAGVHVLADVVDGDQRSVIIVVDDGDGCVDPARALAHTGTSVRALTHCVLRADAARDVDLGLELGTETITLPPPTNHLALQPQALASRSDGIALEIDSITVAIPVGVPTIAAVIRVWDRGTPSSHVELNITSETARLRDLEWLSPGVASVELVVPTYTPVVDLTVSIPGGVKQASILVDPGPPIELAITAPVHVLPWQPFTITPRVTTTSGGSVAADRVSVVPLDACAPVEPQRFTCRDAGAARFVVRVRHGEVMVPIEIVTVDVERAPLVAPPPPPPPPPSALWWSATARATRDQLGIGGGVAATVGLDLGRISATAAVSWIGHSDRLAGLDPVTSHMQLTVHEVGAIASIATSRAGFSARIGAGPVLAIETATIDAQEDRSLALEAAAQLAVAWRFSSGRQFFELELGAQAHADVVSERWVCPALAVFAGVTVGRR